MGAMAQDTSPAVVEDRLECSCVEKKRNKQAGRMNNRYATFV